MAEAELEEHFVGKRIVRCSAANDTKVIDGIAPSRLEAALVGRTISGARRKGKNLWLELDSPPFPSFQFGPSAVSPTQEWPLKYSKLLVEPEAVPPISELGPDALFEPLQFDDFVQSLSRKNTPIKALLLDQSFISGIGNWIADEVLYQARIHPMQTASKISKDKSKALHQCIKEVIETSLEVGADSRKKIDFVTVCGRTSAYVPELQKLDGIDATASRAKISKEKGKSNKVAREVDNDEEAKPAKRGRKQSVKETDEENVADVKVPKRGRKQPAKTSKGSSKKAHHSSEDSSGDDSDEETDDKRDSTQSAKELKSSSNTGGSVVPAKRPERKKRQL
uniref:DNA-(apurinic or apyrimidinic site) lyase n=1 Tax=Leersia perrieri TaxID=77586 RepID=A0A0D9X6I5_9ORYZ